MGRTFARVGYAQSEHYKLDKMRGFAASKKASSRNSAANANRNIQDETEFIPFNRSDTQFMKHHWACHKSGTAVGNVPNHHIATVEAMLFDEDKLGERWREGKLEDLIQRQIDKEGPQGPNFRMNRDNRSSYLRASQKQLQRRGELSAFAGHVNRDKRSKAIID